MRGIAGAGVIALALSACVSDHGAFYADYTIALSSNGMLREEWNPADAPFDDADLQRNFARIAFFQEYSRKDDELIEEATPQPLSRWSVPIRYQLAGASLREADESAYADLSERLMDLTGLDIAPVSGREKPNLTILVLSPYERSLFPGLLREKKLEKRLALLDAWAKEPRYPCVGQVLFSEENSGEIISGMIVLKGELEGVMRRSCIDEEFTQMLGLMNDDPDVRPSIFNDNQEFARLTYHDEQLLRILYDPRLEPGMSEAEAMALVPEIIAGLDWEQAALD